MIVSQRELKVRKNGLIGLALLAGLLGLGLALVSTYRAAAQAPAPTPVISDDQVNAVARQLYCPVCENIRWMFAPPRPAPNGAN